MDDEKDNVYFKHRFEKRLPLCQRQNEFSLRANMDEICDSTKISGAKTDKDLRECVSKTTAHDFISPKHLTSLHQSQQREGANENTWLNG